MKVFESSGNAMLAAAEGNLALSRVLASTVKGWIANFKSWLGDMPTTLPPTESHYR